MFSFLVRDQDQEIHITSSDPKFFQVITYSFANNGMPMTVRKKSGCCLVSVFSGTLEEASALIKRNGLEPIRLNAPNREMLHVIDPKYGMRRPT